MSTNVLDARPVLHPQPRPGADPAPVRACHYCLDEFTPTCDPKDGSLWDLDDNGKHCCNDCHCSTCLTGHQPDQTCPAALEPADRDIVAREEAAVYGEDPDARYDAMVEACLGDSD